MSYLLPPRLAAWLLRLFGWRVVCRFVRVPKAVLIFYPHTSNWDFVVGVLARAALDLPVHFAAKDNLFRWPFGWMFRKLGGLPVNRREHTGLVAQLAAEFARRDSFYLAITPEGTRRATSHIKSGFYRVALQARLPVICSFIDYPRREVGILGSVTLCGDEAADLATIAALYSGCRGRYPAQQGPFKFAERAKGNQDAA